MRDEGKVVLSLFIPHPSSFIPALARPLPQAVLTGIHTLSEPGLGLRHGLNQSAYDLIGICLLRFGLKVEKDAMAQDCGGDRAYVFARDVVATVQDGAGLAAKDQKL